MYEMMPAISEDSMTNQRNAVRSGSTSNKGDKLGRAHRVESVSASFIRESQASLPGSALRSAVKVEKDKVTWMEPPVIKETIIEASLDDENQEYKIDKITHKIKRKKVKKKPALPPSEPEDVAQMAKEPRATVGVPRQPVHHEEPWNIKI